MIQKKKSKVPLKIGRRIVLTFSIFVVSLIIVGSYSPSLPVFAQATTSTYENPAVGLRFEYPSDWDLRETLIGLVMTPDESSRFPIIVIPLVNLDVPNPTIKDLARNQYENEIATLLTPTVLNDNQTTIGQNYTALQLEYTFEEFPGGSPVTRHGLVVWAINDDTGYQFNYTSDEGAAFSKNLPEVNKLLDSVEFIPRVIEEPKMPSFME